MIKKLDIRKALSFILAVLLLSALFIPAGQPPLKGIVLFNELRYLTALLAVNDNPFFLITRMELDRPGVSYTVDTLWMLREQTDAKLFFIIGADEKMQLSKWKDHELLPSLCEWITVTRPRYEAKGAVSIPGIDISGISSLFSSVFVILSFAESSFPVIVLSCVSRTNLFKISFIK